MYTYVLLYVEISMYAIAAQFRGVEANMAKNINRGAITRLMKPQLWENTGAEDAAQLLEWCLKL